MKTYNTYAEAKAENPDSEIVTTGPDWERSKELAGKFEVLEINDGKRDTWHELHDDAWVICKPEDYEEKQPQWNGEGYPPVGVECEIYCPVNPEDPDGDKHWAKTEIVAIIDCGFGANTTVVYTTGWSGNWYVDAHPSDALKFRKHETPEQKKEREELEAAYDLFLTFYQGINVSFEEFSVSYDFEDWVRLVQKTNYTPSNQNKLQG